MPAGQSNSRAHRVAGHPAERRADRANRREQPNVTSTPYIDNGEGPANSSPPVGPKRLPTPVQSSERHFSSESDLLSDPDLPSEDEPELPLPPSQARRASNITTTNMPSSSARARRKSVEMTEEERTSVYAEEKRITSNMDELWSDRSIDADQKLDEIKSMILEKQQDLHEAQRKNRDMEEVNAGMKYKVSELQDSNEHLYDDVRDAHEKIDSLTTALEATQKLIDSSGSNGNVSPEQLRRAEEDKRALEGHLEACGAQIAELQQELERLKRTDQDELRGLGRGAINLSMLQRNEGRERTLAFVLEQYVAMHDELKKLQRHFGELRADDIARYEHGRNAIQPGSAQLQRAPARLTTGTLDREMADAFEVDAQMWTLPDKHVAPWQVRMERRLGRTKPVVKRPGNSAKRPSRPRECRQGHSEARAASTYLQYRTKKPNDDVLKPVGRRSGMAKVHSRKRPRLLKMSDMVRRMEKESEVQKLPPIPRDLMPRNYVPDAYRKRDEAALAKAAELWSLSDDSDSTETAPEPLPQVRLITEKQVVDHYIPRVTQFTTPRYLPKEPKPISRDERRHWAKISNQWSLGPAKNTQPKKKVRFANRVEYEPNYREPAPRKPKRRNQLESDFNWSAFIIALLLILLVGSHLYRTPVFSWKEYNQRPEDIVARLRTTGPGEGTNDMADFEMARWSDVDPSVMG